MDSWVDERTLYLFSGQERADLAPVKAAKLALGVEETVRPVGLNLLGMTEHGSIGFDARVLAIGHRPPFFCNYALTTEATTPAGWERALSWVLGFTEHDPKATLIEDIVVSIFPGAREITPEELAGEVKFRDYQQARA